MKTEIEFSYDNQNLLLLPGKRFQSEQKQFNIPYNTWVR